MPITQRINTMVNAPSITRLSTFEADVDYTLNTGLQIRAEEMNEFADQANAQAADVTYRATLMTLNATTDASTTSNTIGTGAKTFTVTPSRSFIGGMFLVIADAVAPSINSMFCQVTSYSGSTLVVNVISILGSGTKASWLISQSSLLSAASVYTQANILGAVSQSGGVPTGAIIENITNANGSAIKYADGTMICTSYRDQGIRGITAALGAIFYSPNAITITYPVAFVGAFPSVTTNFIAAGGVTWGTTASVNLLNSSYYLIRPTAQFNEQVYSSTVAIGRWY